MPYQPRFSKTSNGSFVTGFGSTCSRWLGITGISLAIVASSAIVLIPLGILFLLEPGKEASAIVVAVTVVMLPILMYFFAELDTKEIWFVQCGATAVLSAFLANMQKQEVVATCAC